MLKLILTCGIPGSGKSTWAKAEIAREPNNWVRINNDDIRAMTNGSVWSSDYEKLITDTRNFMIKTALKRSKNVIVDNLNLNRRHFDDCVKIARESHQDVQIMEKGFYVELDEAIARDAKREGKAKVGEEVIKKWWKDSGKTQFKHFKPRVEIVKFTPSQEVLEYAIQDANAVKSIICDLDGSLALLNGRSPYDATNCHLDLPHTPVVETVKMFASNGYHIIFCSGREDKHRAATIQFIDQHCPGIKYDLHMRATNDFRKDAVVKQEIYDNHIKSKFNVLLVLDDRKQVVDFWRSIPLPCFQVAEGNF